MNREEILNKYIDLIDKGYCCACNELNCIDNFPHAKITHAIKELQRENKELKEENEFLKSEIEEAKRIIQKYLEYIDERDERIDKTIKYIESNNETLYTYEPDYDYEENMVDNYDISNYREDLLKILKEVE